MSDSTLTTIPGEPVWGHVLMVRSLPPSMGALYTPHCFRSRPARWETLNGGAGVVRPGEERECWFAAISLGAWPAGDSNSNVFGYER